MRKCWTHNSRADQAVVLVGGSRAWLRCPWAAAGPSRESHRLAWQHTAHHAPPVCRPPEGPEGLAAAPVGDGRAWATPNPHVISLGHF